MNKKRVIQLSITTILLFSIILVSGIKAPILITKEQPAIIQPENTTETSLETTTTEETPLPLIEVGKPVRQTMNTTDPTYQPAGALNTSIKKQHKKDFTITQEETYEIEYYLPGPTQEEYHINEQKKEIIISSPYHYENVKATTKLEKNIPLHRARDITLYWKENDTYLSFNYSDDNNDRIIDTITWIVPHLSTQTFSVIIIIQAEHLDSQGNFIEDIYDSVSTLDDYWSPEIHEGETVRIVFEKELTNTNDITIFPKIITGNPTIEVYTTHTGEKVGEFTPILDSWFNKILLTNMQGVHNTFDLKIKGGSISFNLIIDPSTTALISSNASTVATATTSGSFTAGKNIIRLNDGRLIAFWEDAANDASCSDSTNDGITWGTINSEVGTHGDLAITTNGSSILYIITEELGADLDFIIRNTGVCDVSSGAFADVGATTNDNYRPDAAYDAFYNKYVVCSMDNDDFDIDYSRSIANPTMTWTTVAAVGGARTIQSCSLDVSPLGNVYIAGDDAAAVVVLNSTDNYTSTTTVTAYNAAVNDLHLSLREYDILITGVITSNSDLLILNSSNNGSSYNNFSLIGTFSEAEGCIDEFGIYHLAVSEGSDIDYISFRDGQFGDFFTIADTVANLRWPSVRCTNYPIANRMSNNELELTYTDTTNSDVYFANFTIPTNRSIYGGPRVNITSPANITYTIPGITFNITLNEPGNCNYSLDNGINNQTMQANTTEDGFNYTNTTMLPGNYTMKAYCTDIAGNSNITETKTFEVRDTQAPNTSFITFTLATGNYSQYFAYANVTTIDNFNTTQTIRIALYNTTHLINTSLNTTEPHFANFTVTADGRYYLNATVNDSSGNTNQTETRSYLLDKTAPNLTLETPTTNTGNYSRNFITVNISANETYHLGTIRVYLYNTTGIVNTTMTSTSSPYFVNYTSLNDGEYYLNATVNDSANNINTTQTRTIILDTVAPLIDILFPGNNTYGFNITSLQTTITDDHLHTCWYNNNTGMGNTTYNCSLLTGLLATSGYHNWTVWANDSAGNAAQATVYFRVNADLPIILLSSPQEGYSYNTNISLNYTVTDTSLDSCWYTINAGNNNSITCNQNVSILNVTEGTNFVTLYANDTDGNIAFRNISFFMDRIRPLLTIIEPQPRWYSGIDTVSFIIDSNENLSSCIITHDTYVTNYSLTNLNDTRFSYTNNSMQQGNYTTIFWCNDTTNNINNTQTRSFGIDSTTPNISFISQTLNPGNYSQNFILINLGANDSHSGIQYVTLGLYNTTGLINATMNSTLSTYEVNYTGLPDGTYYFNATAYDIVNNQNNTTTQTYFLDTGIPNAELWMPLNETFSAQDQNFTVNVSDNQGIERVVLNIFNSTGFLINQTTTYLNGIVTATVGSFVLLSQGVYSWFYQIFDYAGNIFETTNRTFVKDAPPYDNITIKAGSNATNATGMTAITFGQAMNSTNYTTLLSGRTDTDTMYSLTPYNQTTQGFNIRVEDDTGAAELGNLEWAAISYGDWQTIKCDNATTAGGVITFPTPFTNTNYAVIANSIDDDDSPLINFVASTKTTHNITLDIEDDGGANEIVVASSYCAIAHGEHNLSGTLLYAGSSTTAGAGDTTINFATAIPGGNYVVLAMAEGINAALCAPETVTKTGSSFTIHFEDDASANCASRNFDWIAIQITESSIDNTPPHMIINSPSPDTLNQSSNSIEFRVNLNEEGSMCRFSIDSWTTNYTMNKYSSGGFNYTNNSMQEGTYQARFYCNDTYSNYNDTQRVNFTIDTIAPNITYETPTTTTGNHSQTFITANISANDTNSGLGMITMRLYNTSHLINNTMMSSTSPYLVNYTGLNDGLYYINATANDSAGNTNQTETRTYRLDTKGPNITFSTSSTATGNYSQNFITANITANDALIGIDKISIFLYNETHLINQTMTSTTSPYLANYTGLNDGLYYINATANDTTGNTNQTETRHIRLDRTPPTITFNTSSTATGNYSQNFITANITANDAYLGLATIRIFLYNNTHLINQTMTSTTSPYLANYTGLNDGLYYINATANDTLNNINQTETRTYRLDTKGPNITFTTPTPNNGNYSRTFITANITANDTNTGLSLITIRLYNQTHLINQTMTSTTSPYLANYTNLPQGQYQLNATANDTLNNINNTETRIIWLDANAPTLQLTYPSNNTNFTGYLIPAFTINTTDANNITCSLYGTWNGGWHNNQTIYPSPGIETNFSQINTSADGEYVWGVQCTDNFGNLNISQNRTITTYYPVEDFNESSFIITQETPNNTSSITITWQAVPHKQYYDIYSTNNLTQAFTYLNRTTTENFTDYQANSSKRKFYKVYVTNPISNNSSDTILGKTAYTLEKNSNGTQNWINLYLYNEALLTANQTLNNYTNITTITMWNSSIQRRVTCNTFSCPGSLSCTPTNCNFNFDINQSHSYEVNLNTTLPNKTGWSTVGILRNTTAVTLEKNTSSFGKNWVGLYANTTLTNAISLIQNISNADAVSGWNATSQTSLGLTPNPFPWIPGPYLGNFNLEIEQGYEVSVNATTLWNRI